MTRYKLRLAFVLANFLGFISSSASAEETAEALPGTRSPESSPRAQPSPAVGTYPARLAARRSLRLELSVFSQLWGISTDYPDETLANAERDLETSALESGPVSYGSALGFGARYHYLGHLGVQARLIVGLHRVSAGASDRLITMTSSVLELTPIIGPLGRFYAGPTVFVGALLFDGRAFLYPEGEPRDRLTPLLVFGAGGEIGVHLGPREEVALFLKLLVGGFANRGPLGTQNSFGHPAAGASVAF